MSTKAYDEALDFMPSRAVRGGGGGFGRLLVTLIEAFADGRRAEADYKRLVRRGMDPSEAVHRAFAGSDRK